MMAATEARRKSFGCYRAAGSDVRCLFLVTLRGLELPRRGQGFQSCPLQVEMHWAPKATRVQYSSLNYIAESAKSSTIVSIHPAAEKRNSRKLGGAEDTKR